MSLLAITREVSPALNQCELSWQERQPIDVAKANAQHRAYQDCLRDLGLEVLTLPAEPDLPDSVFVEDPVIALDECAIILNMGASSRRPEAISLANALAPYRRLEFLKEPATADGGDLLRVGRRLFLGLSSRTNRTALDQFRALLGNHGYDVQPITVTGCLHLKSACSYLGKNTILLNRSWIDSTALRDFQLLDVPEEEPGAANVLLVNGTIVLPSSFAKTKRLLEGHGFDVRSVDVSELQKAEAGVTCCSVIFNSEAGVPS
jgi:dimethylargininase